MYRDLIVIFRLVPQDRSLVKVGAGTKKVLRGFWSFQKVKTGSADVFLREMSLSFKAAAKIRSSVNVSLENRQILIKVGDFRMNDHQCQTGNVMTVCTRHLGWNFTLLYANFYLFFFSGVGIIYYIIFIYVWYIILFSRARRIVACYYRYIVHEIFKSVRVVVNSDDNLVYAQIVSVFIKLNILSICLQMWQR